MTNTIQNNYVQLANTFWWNTDQQRTFPRNIEQAILRNFPVAIIHLPKLGLTSIKKWLETRDLEMPFAGKERHIRACLLARCGHGLIFLDGTDPDDERRFSLAHEIAHYILDYHIKRQAIIRLFGNKIIDVLDGKREATIEERLNGILSGITVGPFMHLMDRDKQGYVNNQYILNIEDGAERFALELTAPKKALEHYLDQHFPGWFKQHNHANHSELAAGIFGIPQRILVEYISYLANLRRPPQSFKDWLGWPQSKY
jgi:hypothetical protein